MPNADITTVTLSGARNAADEAPQASFNNEIGGPAAVEEVTRKVPDEVAIAQEDQDTVQIIVAESLDHGIADATAQFEEEVARASAAAEIKSTDDVFGEVRQPQHEPSATLANASLAEKEAAAMANDGFDACT